MGIIFAALLAVGSNAASVLFQDEILKVGEKLVSPSGRYTAIMQTDGNFCVYNDYESNSALAANHDGYQFGTAQDGGYKPEVADGYFIKMNYDGNLMLFKESKLIWGSKESGGYRGGRGSWKASLEDDGSIRVYNHGEVKFATWTSGRGH